jgi:hypothetical protein
VETKDTGQITTRYYLILLMTTPWKAAFYPGAVHVGFVVNCGTGTGFFPEYFGFPLSV